MKDGFFFDGKKLVKAQAVTQLEALADRKYFSAVLQAVWRKYPTYAAEIARAVDCTKDTAKSTLDDLAGLGLIKETKRIGDRVFYEPDKALLFMPERVPKEIELGDLPSSAMQFFVDAVNKPRYLPPFFTEKEIPFICPGSIDAERRVSSGLDYCAALAILQAFKGSKAFPLVEDVILEDQIVLASPLKSKENIIAIGSSKVNHVVAVLNDKYENDFDAMPVFFTGNPRVEIRVKKKVFGDDGPSTRNRAAIYQAVSPFDEEKRILVVGGLHRQGTLLAARALINGVWKPKHRAIVLNETADGEIFIEEEI